MLYLDVTAKSPVCALVERLANSRSRALLRMYTDHENSLVRATAIRSLATLNGASA
jgi:hypothetical protein